MSARDRPPLVALRSNDIAFLGILRSAGISQIPIVPVVYTWPSAQPWYSNASKYFNSPLSIPNPAEDERGAVLELVKIGQKLFWEWGQKLMLLPSSDTNIRLIANNWQTLSPYFLQLGSRDFVESRTDVHNKIQQYQLLVDAGLPIPTSYSCRVSDDIKTIADKMSYPCIYKPAVKDYSQSFQNRHSMRKAVECSGSIELVARVLAEQRFGYHLIIQDKIRFESTDDELSCCIYAGQDSLVQMVTCSRKRACFPATYGTGTMIELTHNANVVELAQLVAKSLRWRGMMEIEFMRDSRSQEWKILEVNGRPWLYHHFMSIHGFNYIDALYSDLYECNEQSLSPQVPEICLLQQKPAYAGLTALLDEHIGKGTADRYESFSQWLGAQKNPLDFCYLDKNDPEPGNLLLSDLAAKHGPKLVPLLDALRQQVNETE